jgi:hypothetical protein
VAQVSLAEDDDVIKAGRGSWFQYRYLFGSPTPAFSGGTFRNFCSKSSRPVGTGRVRLQICEGGILRSIAIDDLYLKAAQLAYGRRPSTTFRQGLDQNLAAFGQFGQCGNQLSFRHYRLLWFARCQQIPPSTKPRG